MIKNRLRSDGNADLEPYRDYYVEAVLRLANHFQGLAGQVGYPNIPHAMLMHHNILNGLFLNDVLTALKADGWSLIDAKEGWGEKKMDALRL